MAWPLFWLATIKQNRECGGLWVCHTHCTSVCNRVRDRDWYSLSMYCYRASSEMSDAAVAVRPNCSSAQHSKVTHSLHKHLAWPLQFCFLRLCTIWGLKVIVHHCLAHLPWNLPGITCMYHSLSLFHTVSMHLPASFQHTLPKLGCRVLHRGHVPRDEYWRVLQQADVVVSTAKHEFFGVAMWVSACYVSVCVFWVPNCC